MLNVNYLFKQQYRIFKLASNHFARLNNTRVNKSVLLNLNDNNNLIDKQIISEIKIKENLSIENIE